MARAKRSLPSPTVAQAIALLTSELARLQRIDTGESSCEALELERHRLASEQREHRLSIDLYDGVRRERDAIAEGRDRIRGERDAALARLAELERLPARQTIEQPLREQIAKLERECLSMRTRLGDVTAGEECRATAAAMIAAEDGASERDALADHHALCWRALRDAIVSMQGATEAEGEGDAARRIGAPDHPLESLAESVLRASEGAASMGALSCSRTIAAELHALARDAVAWRTFVRAISDDDWRDNPCDESSAGSDMHERIERVERTQGAGKSTRHNVAPWTIDHAGGCGEALSAAAMEGLAYSQTAADDTWRNHVEASDKLADTGEHGEWWRTFVATIVGSPKLDGSTSRLAWALRRGGLPVTSTDESIETVEACAEIIGTVLDRLAVNRVA